MLAPDLSSVALLFTGYFLLCLCQRFIAGSLTYRFAAACFTQALI